MAPVIGKLTAYWTAAKKTYEATAKYKKPADKVLFWRAGTGIEAAMKKVDATAAKAWTNQSKFNAYDKAVLALEHVQTPYYTKLNDIVEAAQKDQGIPAGVAKDVYIKAIGDLRDALSDCYATARKHKGQATTALNMSKSLVATVERGLTFAAKVRNDPKPGTFNGGISKASRDITQQLANIGNLKEAGMDTGYQAPENLVTILTAWSNRGRVVPSTATVKEVLRETNAFEQAVQGVRKWLDAGGQ